MGMSSWLTSDTQKSIRIDHKRTVYLLQPNGLPPIAEDCYEGCCDFGDTNAHVWLAEMNVADIDHLSVEEKRLMGIAIECGSVLMDVQTNEFWHIMSDYRRLVPGHFFDGNYMQPIPAFGGKTPSDLIKEKRLVRRDIRDLFAIRYPLKFSFNAEADYESLPAAQDAPDQGFL